LIKEYAAALFNSEVLSGEIVNRCTQTNNSYELCLSFLNFSPFSSNFTVVNSAVAVVQSIAISLTVMFFLIEFFEKTLHLEWVKWENILMLLMKMIVAKVLISNAPALMNIVYDVFQSLQQELSGLLAQVNSSATWTGSARGFLPETFISGSGGIGGRDLFIGDAQAWTAIVDDDKNFFGTTAFVKWLQLQPTFLLMDITMVGCQVVTLGRVFELMVYTITAPISMSTFASSATSDVGKSFVKSYCAVCLQAFVLVVMFITFRQLLPAVIQQVSAISGYGSAVALLLTITLGMGVLKSGSWAKKICGTA